MKCSRAKFISKAPKEQNFVGKICGMHFEQKYPLVFMHTLLWAFSFEMFIKSLSVAESFRADIQVTFLSLSFSPEHLISEVS